jgi:hypothetical protein
MDTTMNNANLHTTGTTTARSTGATSATVPTTNTGPGVGSATTTTTTTAPTGMGNAGVVGGNAPATRQTTNPVKAGFAAVHGLGETVRGAFNSAVDGVFNEVCFLVSRYVPSFSVALFCWNLLPIYLFGVL